MKNNSKKELVMQPDFEFDKDAIIEKQTKTSIILDFFTKQGTATDFNVLKYKGVLYQIGNYIEVWDTSLKEPYVGKLFRIVQVKKNVLPVPFIQIEWCLRKKDLPKHILDLFGKHISNAQIFPSTIKYCIQIPSIKGKCQIFQLEEYDQMTLSHQNYYFTRANYNDVKQELLPHPNTWKTQCCCGAPENPDLQYVQCEKCNEWFHVECVTQNNLEATYICKPCERINESSSMFEK